MLSLLGAIPYTTFPVIEIGPLHFRTFGLAVAVGVLVGAWLAARYAEDYGIPRDTTYSLAMRMVLAGVIDEVASRGCSRTSTRWTPPSTPSPSGTAASSSLRRLRVRRDRRLPRVPALEPAHPLEQPGRLRLRPGHRPGDRPHRVHRRRRALRAAKPRSSWPSATTAARSARRTLGDHPARQRASPSSTRPPSTSCSTWW